MSRQTKARGRWLSAFSLAATVAVAGLAACGGGKGDGGPAGPPPVSTAELPSNMTLAAWQLSRGRVIATGSAPSLSEAQAAEVARASRQWAVASLDGITTPTPANALVISPLHFGAVQVVAAAARGSTLTEWRGLFPAASGAAVEQALSAGLQREVLVNSGSKLEGSFFSALEGPAHAPLWLAHEGRGVSDWRTEGHVANTRVVVRDRFEHRWAWPDAVVFEGIFEVGRNRSIAPMLRLTANVKAIEGRGFRAVALRGEAGRRLVAITPVDGVRQFDPPQLAAVLAEVSEAFAPTHWAALPDTTLVLPRDTGVSSGGPQGFGVAAMALEELRANLGAIDGGGTYVVDSGMWQSVGVSASGLSANGQRTLSFIYSPLNPYSTTSVGVFAGQVDWPPACPSTIPDLRPFFLLELDANQRVVWLARWATVPGKACV